MKHSPPPKSSLPRSHGMLLIEMLVALLLTSAVLLIAMRLCAEMLNQMDEAPRTEMKIQSTQLVLAALQRDAWQAMSVQSSSPQSVRFNVRGGRAIEWSVSETGAMKRTDSAGPLVEQSDDLLPGLTFTADPTGLTVQWPAGGSVSEIRCVSQVLITQVEVGGSK